MDPGSIWHGYPYVMGGSSPRLLTLRLPSEGCCSSSACIQALVGYCESLMLRPDVFGLTGGVARGCVALSNKKHCQQKGHEEQAMHSSLRGGDLGGHILHLRVRPLAGVLGGCV